MVNEYFHNRSLDDIRTNNSQVHVMLSSIPDIIGFFTLSMKTFRTSLNGVTKNHPFCLVGQLGIDKHYQGNKMGYLLLREAMRICIKTSRDVACKGLYLETYKEDLVQTFFKKNGFKLYNISTLKGKRKRFELIWLIPNKSKFK